MNIVRKANCITVVLLIVLAIAVITEPQRAANKAHTDNSAFAQCIDIHALSSDTVRAAAFLGHDTPCDHLR